MGQEALLAIVTIWQIGRLADWQRGRVYQGGQRKLGGLLISGVLP